MVRPAALRSQKIIISLWIAFYLVTLVSSQSRFRLNRFEKKKESGLSLKDQPDLRFRRYGVHSGKKQIYMTDPRVKRFTLSSRYGQKLLPVNLDESNEINLENWQPYETAIEYPDHMKEIVMDAVAKLPNLQDSEEEDDINDNYGNIGIEVSDGRLDDEGPIFFNIADDRVNI